MKYFMPLCMSIILIGCSPSTDSAEQHRANEDESVKEETSADDEEKSVSFQQLHFRMGIEDVTVTGSAAAPNDEIFYEVEQGDELIVEETKIPLEDKGEELDDFEVKFDLTEDMEKSDEALVTIFYAKNEQGEKINENFLPINMNLKFYNEDDVED